MNPASMIIFLSLLSNILSGVVRETVTCDFEIDECGWTLNTPWRIYPSGSTPETASSGPTMDHTTGSGRYARFIATAMPESDLIGTMNMNVSLQNAKSFTFWYFMHGNRIGTLALLVNNQTEWEKSGRQGVPAWYQANITLSAGEDVQIAFVASRPELGRSSDIAIDDIALEDEPVPVNNRTTEPPPSTTPRTRFNASCDFDVARELCGWKSDTVYGWKVIEERESDITVGPSSDYSSIMRANNDGKICKIPYEEKNIQYFYCTPNKKVLQCKGTDNKWINCRDGGFVQIQTNQLNEVGERSQFESPVLDALSEEGCVQFQYNIAGSDNDWLNVYVEDYWSGSQTCMWHMEGSSVPDRWIAAESPLHLEMNGTYKIVFEVQKSQVGGMGLVSLDHIVISPARCSGRYPMPKCFPDEASTAVTDAETTMESTITEIFETSMTKISEQTASTTSITTSRETTTTTDSEPMINSTMSSPKAKDFPTVPVVAGVVGGVALVSVIVALLIWREPVLTRLGLKRPNRVAMTSVYTSAADGAVQINAKTEDRRRFV